MIRWQDLDPATVERAVKLLIRELHPTAQGIDGSGGDDGRDITWDSPEGLVIFEVKSYSQRLTNGRKRDIRKSLTNAANHQPVRWVLILPLDPTPAEKSWFDGLKTEFSPVKLEWRGRDWLDAEFAPREHLVRYVEGPLYVLAERATELGHEQAVLANGIPDLAARLGTLSGRAQELSPFWRVDFAVRGNEFHFEYSERFPGAATIDPVTITPVFSFPADDPEAEEAERRLTQTLEYGGDVVVDGRFVERVDIEASEETKKLFDHPEGTTSTGVQFIAVEDNEGLPAPCTLEIVSAEDLVLAAVTVQLSRRTRGNRGVALTGADPSGILQLRTAADHPVDGYYQGSVNIVFEELIGRWPSAVRPVADFVLAAEPGRRVAVRLGHNELGRVEIEADTLTDLKAAARLVIALDELQWSFATSFPVPDGLTMKDLRDLELLAELAATGRAQWPYRAMKVDIHADRLEELLNDNRILTTEKGALVARFESYTWKHGEHRFDFGPVQFYAPRMRLTNLAELQVAVGTGTNPESRWECVDGEHIYVSRLIDSAASDAT
jgi:hypothetical protein